MRTVLSAKAGELRVDDILSLVRGAKTADPKDRVYGILGLLPSEFVERITPDSELSVEDIYCDFAKILFNAKGLDALFS